MTSRSGNPSTDPCLQAALRLLARRDHFSTELSQKLKQKGFLLSEITATIERLRRMRYLDDRRALAAYAEEMKRHRKGFFFFLKKLMERGVRELFSDGELRAVYPLEEEQQVARELVRKMGWGEGERRRRLISRGFSMEAVGEGEREGEW